MSASGFPVFEGRWWEGLRGFGEWTAEDGWFVVTGIEAADIPDLVQAVVDLGGRIGAVVPEHRSLEDRFLELPGTVMIPALVITRLTVREAVRRKLVAVLLLLSFAMVGLSAWGFDRLAHTHSVTSGEVQIALPQALILFMFMFSFVVALSASAIASPAVSAEIESGVLQTVATRPIRRSEILIGKWLGLALLVAAYSVLVAVLEMVVVNAVSGFLPRTQLQSLRTSSQKVQCS